MAEKFRQGSYCVLTENHDDGADDFRDMLYIIDHNFILYGNAIKGLCDTSADRAAARQAYRNTREAIDSLAGMLRRNTCYSNSAGIDNLNELVDIYDKRLEKYKGISQIISDGCVMSGPQQVLPVEVVPLEIDDIKMPDVSYENWAASART